MLFSLKQRLVNLAPASPSGGVFAPTYATLPPMSTMIARLIAYFFVGVLYAVGPLLLLIAIASSIPTAEFVLASTATDGTIVELERVYSKRHRYVYEPVFRFTANDGQTHMIRSDSNTALVPFKRGDRIRVLYLKDHPETARVDMLSQLWMPQLILAVLGAVFTAFSVRIPIRKRALRRAAAIS